MLRYRLALFLLWIVCSVNAQTQHTILRADSLSRLLQKNWKYNTSDNAAFATAGFDDNAWKTASPLLPVDELDSLGFKGFAWFRLHIELPKELVNKNLVINLQQLGASELYVDGQLLATYGKATTDGVKEERINPISIFLPVIFKDSTHHVIAIRYSNHKFDTYALWDDFEAGFRLTLDRDVNQTLLYYNSLSRINIVLLGVGGFLFALTFMHVAFYIFYRKQKHHLYYSLFTFFFALFFFLPYFSLNLNDPDITEPVGYFIPMVVPVYFISLAGFTYYLTLGKIPRTLWLSILVGIIIFIGFFYKTGLNQFLYMILIFLVIHQTFTALRQGKKLKKEGIRIIRRGFLIFVAFVSFLGVNSLLMWTGIFGHVNINQDTIYFLLPGILSIPVSISLYMARNFATLNINLEKKLAEVEELSARSLEQEKEKQHLLASQNQVLEQKVKERTAEVVAQKDLLEEKQKEILDSIRYARRIQTSLLPTEKLIQKMLSKKSIN